MENKFRISVKSVCVTKISDTILIAAHFVRSLLGSYCNEAARAANIILNNRMELNPGNRDAHSPSQTGNLNQKDLSYQACVIRWDPRLYI